MRVTLTSMIVAAALMCVGCAARAQNVTPRNHDPRVAFTETDLNQDGVIDHGEFQDRMAEVFFSADRNKDGFLDPQELKSLVFPDDFKDDDKDKDGRVSMREFFRVRFHDYDVADANHDGVLELEEVIAAFEGRKPR